MATGRRIAATLTIVGTAALLGVAAAAALTLPSTTTPTTTLPSLTVPTVTTPTVTTPKLSTPTVTTPTVTTPTATTPQVSTPKVTTPKVTAPQVSPAPSSKTPSSGSPTSSAQTLAGQALGGGGSATGGLAGAGGGSSSIPGSSSVLGGQGGSSTQGAGGTGQAPSNGTSGAVTPFSGGPGSGAGGPGAFGGGLGSSATMLLPGGPDTLQLRAALAPLLGCFYAISPFQQELLVMRAGLDGHAPLSRAQLATAFGVSQRDVLRNEKLALREMRSAAHEDGCMTAATTGGLVALAQSFIAGPFGPPGFVNPATGSVGRPAVAVAVAGAPSPAIESRSITDQLAALGGTENIGPVWLILLVTFGLCLAFGALLREARRSV